MTPENLNILGMSLQAIGWVFLPFLLTPILCVLLPKSKFLTGFQSSIIHIINDCNVWIGEAVKYLLPALVISVAFATIALSIFGQAWTKLDESAIYLHTAVILLGSAATFLAGKHVRVDIFYAGMPPKSKAFVDLVGYYALLVPFCLILIWNSQNFVGLAWTSLEGSSESDGIKGVFILKTFMSVFAVMMLTQGLSIAGAAALFLRGHPGPKYPPNIDDPFTAENDRVNTNTRELSKNNHLETGL